MTDPTRDEMTVYVAQEEVDAELGRLLTRGERGSGKSNLALMILAELAHGRPVTIGDPKTGTDREVWLAMTGHRDVSQSEQAAIERGIDPETYRRLYPAVTGDLADQLYARVIYLASHLAAHLVCNTDDDDVSDRLCTDPRTPGFRLALFEARRLATTEQMRKVAMFAEWAMNSIEAGDEEIARGKLDRADRILA